MWKRVTRLEPIDPKGIVSALQTFLQHCDVLNERELIGLCKVVSDQRMRGEIECG